MTDTRRGESPVHRRMGLPTLAGRVPFVAANLVDSFGNGLVLAFLVVFFTKTTDLAVAEIGTALTVGRLAALASTPVLGPLLDRLGPRWIVVLGNLVAAAGFAVFVGAGSAWAIALAQAVVQFGMGAYFTASAPLTIRVAGGRDRTRWLSLVRSLRNTGIGLGAAAASLALTIDDPAVLRGVMAGDALTFVVAAWLIHRTPLAARADADEPPRAAARAGNEGSPSYRAALRDGPYMALVVTNLTFGFAAAVISVLLALYVVTVLQLGAWVVGSVVVLNTVVVALGQPVASLWIERRSPLRALTVAALVNVAAFTLFGLARFVGTPGLLLPLLVVAVLVYTLAELLALVPLFDLSVALAPAAAPGRHQALFQGAWSLSSALAPAVLTTLLALDPSLPWLVLVALSVVSLALTLGLARRQRAGPTGPTTRPDNTPFHGSEPQ